jgi:hypothetical protein
MVYQKSIDYHMATPNLPEIKSYIDSVQAQKILSNQDSGSGSDKAAPFHADSLSSFPAAFSTNDVAQSPFSKQDTSSKKSGFSWKTISICILFLVAFVVIYYYQYDQIRRAKNLAGYETQKLMDRFSLKDQLTSIYHNLHSTGKYVGKLTGRIMDMDETILSPI